MHTKLFIKSLAGAVLTCSICATSLAEVVVIVHPSNAAAFDEKGIQRIFLGKAKKFSTGKEALPINQIADSPSRASFDTDTLGRTSSQVSAYWSKRLFTGKGTPPKEVDSDADVLALVADNPNAIGYVDSSAATDAVKVLSLN